MNKKYLKFLVVGFLAVAAGLFYVVSMPEDEMVLRTVSQEGDLPEGALRENPMPESAMQENPMQEGALQENTITENALLENGMSENASQEKTEQENTGQYNTLKETVSMCFVHVCGAVNCPGVYELPEGSRLSDAVTAAGGFTEEAAGDFLNLAETVSDGMKVAVPSVRELEEESKSVLGIDFSGMDFSKNSSGIAASGGNGAGGGAGSKVNINTASKEELMTLRGIGESRAADIISYREKHGGFKKIEDIMKISGIKEAAFEKIKDDITV